MKLVSYKRKGSDQEFRIGCLYDGKIADLYDLQQKMIREKAASEKAPDTSALLPSSSAAFFRQGTEAVETAKKVLNYGLERNWENNFRSQDQFILGPPVSAPSKIICIGTNYADHIAEMKGDVPDYPVLFAKYNNALIGPEDFIEKSKVTKKLDYEAELVVVIGKRASKVKKEDALDYVAGYTIGNDVSARDLQKRTAQWLQGKSLDNSTPIGPSVVTKDQIENPGQLKISSYVNGEKRQNSTTESMIFDVPFLIEFISELITLEPGDIIFTGTPEGVGFGMNPPAFLKGGDEVVIEIENIGKLVNVIKEV